MHPETINLDIIKSLSSIDKDKILTEIIKLCNSIVLLEERLSDDHIETAEWIIKIIKSK